MTEATDRLAPVETRPGGPRLSRLAVGYWRLADWAMSPQERLAFLERHLDLGISTIDQSPIYGDYRCEQLLGEALRLKPALRERIQIVTKCGINLVSGRRPDHRVKHYDSSVAAIRASVERSLRDLATDRIDLLLLHRPDPLMDADQVAEVFEALREAGLVRFFGVSNFTPRQFELLQSCFAPGLVTNQVEINPLNPGVLFDGTLDLLQQHHIRPMAWSPLAGGRPWREDAEPASRRLGYALEELVRDELPGWSADQLLLAWCLRLPCRPIPVLGTGRPERIESAVAALDLDLTRQQWFRILEAGQGQPVP